MRLERALCVVLAVAALSLTAACRFRGAQPMPDPVEAVENEPWGEPDAVLAEVNGRPITRGEFYLRVLRRFGTMQVLAGVIKEELFLQEAERRGLRISSDQVDARVEEVFAQLERQQGGMRELEAQYRSQGMSMATARRDMAREVSTQLLIGEVTKAMRDIDDEVVLKYYKRTYAHKRYITRQIAYSFFTGPEEPPGAREQRRMEARSKARRAVDRLRAGEDFALLARAESEDPVTAPKGGWLGPVHRDTEMTVPAFKTAIFSLEAGEVSDPIENPGNGFHVFQVTAIQESESFADCREKIVEEIEEMEPDVAEIQAALRELEQRSTVRVHGLPLANRRDSSAAQAAEPPVEDEPPRADDSGSAEATSG